MQFKDAKKLGTLALSPSLASGSEGSKYSRRAREGGGIIMNPMTYTWNGNGSLNAFSQGAEMSVAIFNFLRMGDR